MLNPEELPAAKLGRISETMQALLKLMDVRPKAGRKDIDSDAEGGD